MINLNTIKGKIKSLLPERLKSYIRFYLSLTSTPKSKNAVISDLFPFRTNHNWETYFELLNVPFLINPNENLKTGNRVKFIFFDENGKIFHEETIENQEFNRNTISINNLINGKSISGEGTFACFHLINSSDLLKNGGYLAERGYTGYAKKDYSNVKSYVHGNFDALAFDNGELQCLGKSFLLSKQEYRLQHELIGPASYELAFVNNTQKKQVLDVMLYKNNVHVKKRMVLNPRAIKWYKTTLKDNEVGRIVILSRMNLPRPVVFRLSQSTFDVFHG